LQSPKTFVQSPHNFAKTNLTLFSYFYNPLVLLSVDDFDVPSFHLSIDELIFEVDLHFEVICDVVSTHDFLPIDNVVTNWFFEIDKELENVKNHKRTSKHVEMLVSNVFDEWRNLQGFRIQNIIVDLFENVDSGHACFVYFSSCKNGSISIPFS
jgi:hypothetical protein